MEEKSIWRQISCKASNNACPLGTKSGPPCPIGSAVAAYRPTGWVQRYRQACGYDTGVGFRKVATWASLVCFIQDSSWVSLSLLFVVTLLPFTDYNTIHLWRSVWPSTPRPNTTSCNTTGIKEISQLDTYSWLRRLSAIRGRRSDVPDPLTA